MALYILPINIPGVRVGAINKYTVFLDIFICLESSVILICILSFISTKILAFRKLTFSIWIVSLNKVSGFILRDKVSSLRKLRHGVLGGSTSATEWGQNPSRTDS